MRVTRIIVPDNDDKPVYRPPLFALVLGALMWMAIGVAWIAVGLLLRWGV